MSSGCEYRCLTGILFTESQYFACNENKGKIASDSTKLKFILALTTIKYAAGETITVSKKITKVDYSETVSKEKTKERLLIIKTDSQNHIGLIAINSPHKIYCQLLLASCETGIAIHMKTIKLLSSF